METIAVPFLPLILHLCSIKSRVDLFFFFQQEIGPIEYILADHFSLFLSTRPLFSSVSTCAKKNFFLSFFLPIIDVVFFSFFLFFLFLPLLLLKRNKNVHHSSSSSHRILVVAWLAGWLDGWLDGRSVGLCC